MTKTFKKTERQVEATRLLSSDAKHCMLFGGSRSGKTFISCYAIIVRAAKCPHSRHVIFRAKQNHAITSIWHDTLPKVLNVCFPSLKVRWNKSYFYIELENASQIWVAGLDNRERAEKVLGREFSTIYFNECSQLTEDSISIALTRLAQKNNLKKKFYYDMNPPSKKHWTYWKFIKKKSKDGSPVAEENYTALLMNPRDNQENIDESYITDILAQLAPDDRARFELGEFVDGDNKLIYYSFDRDKHVKEFPLEKGIQYWSGFDFNHSPMCAVFGWIKGNTLYIYDEVYQESKNIMKGMTATQSAAMKMVAKYGKGIIAVPDSTGKKMTSNANKSDLKILKNCGFVVKALNNPFRVDRYSAANAALNKMRVVIHPQCKYTIKDLEEQSYKDGTDQPDTSDPDIGHIADAWSYLVFRTVNPLRGGTVKAHTQGR